MSDAEYEYEEVSDEEKLKIATAFLLQSPPGQFSDVLKDVKKLVPSHILTPSAVHEIARLHNTATFISSPIDENRNILICQDAQVDETHYADTHGRQVLGYDHLKQTVVVDDVAELPSSFDNAQFEEERSAIQTAMDEYSQAKYNTICDCAVFVQDSSKLVIVLSAERANLRNYWSGKWTSRWEMDCSDSPSTLSGSIRVHVHYFENGNLQLQTKKQDTRKIEFSDPKSLANAIVEAVREAEDQVQSNLEDIYINMSNETFKEMRRVTPITQMKMDWNISQHRAIRHLVCEKPPQ